MNDAHFDLEDDSPTPKADLESFSPVLPSGIAAIQGLGEQPDPQAVYQVSPEEEVDSSPPALTPAAANDLSLAARQADAAKSTHYHNDTEGSNIAEYKRIRAEISECLAANNIPEGIRADAFSPGGTNFPNYDVFSPGEACSVKCYTTKEGEPAYGRLRQDFAELVNPDSKKNCQAAACLLSLKNSNYEGWTQLAPHLPSAVRNAGGEEALRQALADSATMRIPDDQVDQVRTDLMQQMFSNPQRYGLNTNCSEIEFAKQIEDRAFKSILSIDERYVTTHYQAKAAELNGARVRMLKLRLRG